MEKKIKIVLLSGGSLVGRNILDSLYQRRSSLELIAMNSVAQEPSLFEFDKVFLSPSLIENPIEFADFFLKVIGQEKPHLVVPCRDEDVAFLSRIAGEGFPSSISFLCGPSSIAQAFLDKWASWQFSRALDLPFAPTLNMDAEDQSKIDFIAEHKFPMIAKPRKGFGSLGVFLVTEESQLENLKHREDYIIQKYLGNPLVVSDYLSKSKNQGVPLFHSFEQIKLSIQASIGPDGEDGGMVITEHVMKQGISARVNLNQNETLYQQAKTWVNKIALAGWVGPLNIQCQSDPDGQVMIYEFNGRFTGATSARYFLGFDELGLALSLWLGVTLPENQSVTCHHSVFRIPSSKPLQANFIEELAEMGVWTSQSKIVFNKEELLP